MNNDQPVPSYEIPFVDISDLNIEDQVSVDAVADQVEMKVMYTDTPVGRFMVMRYLFTNSHTKKTGHVDLLFSLGTLNGFIRFHRDAAKASVAKGLHP